MLAVHALDQGGAPQHLFDLIGLQMADKVPGLAQIGTGIGFFHQLLHMVFAKKINGQRGAFPHGFHSAGLAGGAQQNLAGAAPGSQCGTGHFFTDISYIFSHGSTHCRSPLIYNKEWIKNRAEPWAAQRAFEKNKRPLLRAERKRLSAAQKIF